MQDIGSQFHYITTNYRPILGEDGKQCNRIPPREPTGIWGACGTHQPTIERINVKGDVELFWKRSREIKRF